MDPVRSRAYLLPHLILAFWLTFVGFSVWQHAKKSGQPPIYDAFTYFVKAKIFWASIKEARLFNPLNLEPIVRPPGTVLMSYPFGFSPDFHGFYFRSVFVPILSLVFAIYVVGWSSGMSNTRHWSVGIVSMFLSSLPLFYHFEFVEGFSSPGYWGLVDNFLAGIAAIAAAACFRSVKEQSLLWTILSACFAALCILVKPAGIFVILLVELSWLLSVFLLFKSPGLNQENKKRILRFASSGFTSQALVLGITLFCCFHSRYLSGTIISYGKAAVLILHTEYTPPITYELLHWVLHPSFGYPLLFGTMLAVLASLIYRGRLIFHAQESNRTNLAFAILPACIYLAVGLWFWIVETSITQVRYFFLFAFMAIISAMPLALDVLEVMPRSVKLTLAAGSFIIVINLALLLGQSNPASIWQQFTGVNLTSGSHKEEVEQARSFVRMIQSGTKDVYLYSLDSSARFATFLCTGYYEKTLNSTGPGLVIRLPVDWQRPTVFRFNEILECDYILVQPICDKSVLTRVLEQNSVDTFSQESVLLSVWFSGLTESDGVSVVSETSLRLLKVTDPIRLEASLDQLIQNHSWRPLFLDANPMR